MQQLGIAIDFDSTKGHWSPAPGDNSRLVDEDVECDPSVPTEDAQGMVTQDWAYAGPNLGHSRGNTQCTVIVTWASFICLTTRNAPMSSLLPTAQLFPLGLRCTPQSSSACSSPNCHQGLRNTSSSWRQKGRKRNKPHQRPCSYAVSREGKEHSGIREISIPSPSFQPWKIAVFKPWEQVTMG